MAENTTGSTYPIIPDENRNIRLQPDAINVPETPPSLPANTHQALSSPTNMDSQNTFCRNTFDSSMANPTAHEYLGPQDPSDNLAQTDNILESPARRSTPSIHFQSPSEIPTSNTEAPASATLEPAQVEPKRGWRETIGVWGGAVITGGCIFIFLILGFIYFLWFRGGTGPESTPVSRMWRNIILSGRVVQAITISSLLLRIVVSTQVASCTSLLAALFLERQSVRVSQLPHFSIARATNDGPRALLQMIIGSGTRHMLFTVETLLMLIMALAMLGLQFSSTILLTDLRTRVIVNDPEPVLVNMSLGDPRTPIRNSLVGAAIATFGEALSNSTAQPDAWGVSDTGLKQRALLPFEHPENRTTLRSYEGPATVIKSRVACMPPIINDGILFSTSSNDRAVYIGTIQGTLDYNASFPIGLLNSTLPTCRNSKCEPLALECRIPSSLNIDTGYQSTICIVGPVGGDYWSQDHGLRWNSSDAPWLEHGLIYLVSSTNLMENDWKRVQTPSLVPTRQYNEWTSYEVFPTRYINISMCFVAFSMVDANVSMTASAPLFEPRDRWVLQEVRGGGTQSYRRLLGTDLGHQSHKERGILTLNNPKDVPISDYSTWSYNNGTTETPNPHLTDGLHQTTYGTLTNALSQAERDIGRNNTSFSACLFCQTLGIPQSADIQVIFTDTIIHTKRAALAVDGWVFMTAQSAYSALFQFFDKSTGTSGIPYPNYIVMS
ncbi:hypothetical protein GGR51DRAFT_574648 [Nemania sp. FL0031]|nr:hypothetical protein GGR51DRAFT_574648 [Nemania sp. FL0031]